MNALARILGYRRWRSVGVWLALPSLSPFTFAAAELKACASHTPPFMIFSGDVAVDGFSYRVFLEVARKLSSEPKVILRPWARCLQEVKEGSVDLAIDAYDDAQRRKSYLYSIPYHTLTPQVFYRKSGAILPGIASVSALKKFKGCGVREYTYEHYDLDATTMDRGAADDRRMLLKLNSGQCDYAVEEMEFVVGGRNYDPKWLDESDIASFRPPWARGPQTHFLIGKSRSNADTLLRGVNQAITDLQKSGALKSLEKRYFDAAGRVGTKR